MSAFHIPATTLDEPAPLIKRIPYTACPLCGSAKMVEHATADCSVHPMYDGRLDSTMRWMRCEDCAHVFTDGYWGEDALAILFSRTQPGQKPGDDLERQRYIWARVVEKLWKIAPPVGIPYGSPHTSPIWWDVGCGSGGLLKTALEFGYEPVGFDLRPETVEALRGPRYVVPGVGERRGMDILEASIVDFVGAGVERRPLVISFADVLEHMPDPRAAIVAARKAIRDDGALFVSTPNIMAPAWQEAEPTPYWIEIEHAHNFGRSVMYWLLRTCGFNVVYYGVSERYRFGMEIIATPTDIPDPSEDGVGWRILGAIPASKPSASASAIGAGWR